MIHVVLPEHLRTLAGVKGDVELAVEPPITPRAILDALEANYPVSAIVDGVGLNITVMSYRDHMDFGIVADRDHVDDVWSMMDGVRSALDDLDSVICGRTSRPSAAEPSESPAPSRA